MPIEVIQVDAFARRPFEGNPAAVCPLSAPLSDERMARIAAENNLSETAFCVERPDGDWDLRWFTPTVEVQLCGHATLAAAHVLLGDRPSIRFHTRSGPLTVRRSGDALAMDLPALPPGDVIDDAEVVAALGVEVIALHQVRQVHGARYLLAEVPDAGVVRSMAVPDLGRTNVIVTARGDTADLDFVSRFFAPGSGVPEDPVTGSAHCTLTPFWAARLGRDRLAARQVSRRGGDLICTLCADRVELIGHAVTVKEAVLWPEGPSATAGAVAEEIARLHRGFVALATTGDVAVLDREVGPALDPDFVRVDPTGHVQDRATLLEALGGARSPRPSFGIEVRDVEIVARQGDLVVARYVEVQRRAGSIRDARRSTAVLRRTDGGWRWLSVHETSQTGT